MPRTSETTTVADFLVMSEHARLGLESFATSVRRTFRKRSIEKKKGVR